MKKVQNFLGGLVLGAVTLCAAAFLTGTVIYYLYPIVVPVVLPAMVKDGYLPARLTWWVAVCFSWLWHLLKSKT